MVDILLQKIKENCTNVDLDIVNKASHETTDVLIAKIFLEKKYIL